MGRPTINATAGPESAAPGTASVTLGGARQSSSPCSSVSDSNEGESPEEESSADQNLEM